MVDALLLSRKRCGYSVVEVQETAGRLMKNLKGVCDAVRDVCPGHESLENVLLVRMIPLIFFLRLIS